MKWYYSWCGVPTSGGVHASLDEDNVEMRVGAKRGR
jgi:hypothetical protein